MNLILNFTSQHKGVDTFGSMRLRQHSQKIATGPTSFPIKKLRKTFMTTPSPFSNGQEVDTNGVWVLSQHGTALFGSLFSTKRETDILSDSKQFFFFFHSFLELFFDFSDEKLRCFMLCCKNSFTLIRYRCNKEWNGFTMAWRWCFMYVVYTDGVVIGTRLRLREWVLFCLVFPVIMVMCF